MIRIFLTIIIIVFLCFLIPVIFTTKFENSEEVVAVISNEEIKEEVPKEEKHNYSDYGTIKLLHREN